MNPILDAAATCSGQPRALTFDEIYETAPSVFQTEAHSSRSGRFVPIPTFKVLEALIAEGFSPIGVMSSVVRDASRKEFTKHLIRLRRLEDGERYSAGGAILEILLKNANDGSGAYQLLAGFYRLLCYNSLVVDRGTVDTVRVVHAGRQVIPAVIAGTKQVLERALPVLEKPTEWGTVELSQPEQLALARAAHTFRFPPDPTTGDSTTIGEAIEPERFLKPRRWQDEGRSLWTTFNVIQENVIKGGVGGTVVTRNEDGTTERKRTSTRAVKSVDESLRLNQALWRLTEEMARIKGDQA